MPAEEANRRAEVLVEVVLQVERVAAIRSVFGIKRRSGPLRLEGADDASRVEDPLAVELEHRERVRLSPAPPQGEGHVRRWRRLTPLVLDALPVERPPGLLGVVGDADMPEDGLHCAAISQYQLGCPPRWTSSSMPSGSSRFRSPRAIGGISPSITVTISAPSARRATVAASVEPVPP